MPGPQVSVLLPFHNAEATLERAIRSIADQNFTDHELILIDNASTDRSIDIALAWAARDGRIRIVPEPRTGIAHALNTGLAATHAPLIARMDADDISHRERLEKQVAFLRKHPDIGVLGTRTNFTSSVPHSEGMKVFVDWQNALLTPEDHFLKRFVDAPVAHPSTMFRRELIGRHGGYSTAPLPEDHELWLRWMDAGVGFAKLPDVLLEWRDHPQRLSRTHTNYSTEAFFRTKVFWLARWLARNLNGRPVIVAGAGPLNVERAALLEAAGIAVHAFTDVRARSVRGRSFIPHTTLPSAGEAFIVSFISQRGTGERVATFLRTRGMVEGADFILAA